ncbi:MAG: hypothetical protein AAGF07_02960 [Patescibacteria group bacterium]
MTLESYLNNKPLLDQLNFVSKQNVEDLILAINSSTYSIQDFFDLTTKLGKHIKLGKPANDKSTWAIKEVEGKLELTNTEIEMIEYLAERLEG